MKVIKRLKGTDDVSMITEKINELVDAYNELVNVPEGSVV